MYVSIKPIWSDKEKRWRVDLMRNGVRKTFSSSVPRSEGKRIVREKALAWLESGGKDSMTLAEVYPLFIQEYINKRGNNSQVERIRSAGKNHILPKLGDLKVGRITLDQWQSVLSKAEPVPRLRQDGSNYNPTRQLSKKYLKNIKEVISLFMRWAVPREYMSINYSDELYIPFDAPTKGREILQMEDIRRWFAEPTALWYERALMFELLTGLRPGEVLGIQHGDYKNGVLTIQRSVDKTGKITPGKNENARRRIELVGEVREIFEEQVEVSKGLGSLWVFCSPFGMMPSQQALGKCLDRIKEKLDLSPTLTPYCLRHTFYTQVESYLPQRLMKTIFGHSDSTDSHALYGNHELDGELHEASEKLKVTPLYSIKRATV